MILGCNIIEEDGPTGRASFVPAHWSLHGHPLFVRMLPPTTYPPHVQQLCFTVKSTGHAC